MAASSGRTAALAAARADDSKDKRQRALDALAELEAAGEAVTFPAVARAAGVSTWLVYARGVREHVEATRRRQTVPLAARQANATPAGLQVDLVLAREEIKRLRAEQNKLQQRLRLQLGAEIDGPQQAPSSSRESLISKLSTGASLPNVTPAALRTALFSAECESSRTSLLRHGKACAA